MSPSWMASSRTASAVPVVAGHRAAADEAEPIAGNLDDAPTGAAEPGIDAEDANRARHLCFRDSAGAALSLARRLRGVPDNQAVP